MGRREGSKEEAANRATEEWVVNPQADALSAPKLPFDSPRLFSCLTSTVVGIIGKALVM